MSLAFARLVRGSLPRRNAPPEPVQNIAVDFYNDRVGNPDGSDDYVGTINWTAAPVSAAPSTAGSTLIVKVHMRASDALVSAVDNLGGSVANGAWSIAAAVNPPDSAYLNATFFVRRNAPAGITTLTLTTVLPYFDPRAYIEEVRGLHATAAVAVVSGLAGEATNECVIPVETPVDNCYVTGLISTSPSRNATAVAPSQVQRLNFTGTPRVPYTGPTSEHGVTRVCGAAGPYTLVTQWADGSSNSGYVACIFRPAA